MHVLDECHKCTGRKNIYSKSADNTFTYADIRIFALRKRISLK